MIARRVRRLRRPGMFEPRTEESSSAIRSLRVSWVTLRSSKLLPSVSLGPIVSGRPERVPAESNSLHIFRRYRLAKR
jgi:hypothetical protein